MGDSNDEIAGTRRVVSTGEGAEPALECAASTTVTLFVDSSAFYEEPIRPEDPQRV